jgi:hypothetical protein
MVVSGGVGVGSNLFVGKDLTVSGNMTINAVSLSTTTNLQEVTNDGNTTTNTIEFNNPTTSLVATGNVEVGGELSVSENVEVGTANLFVDTTTGNVGVGTTSPGFPLDVVFSGDSGIRAKSTSSHASLNLDSDSGYGYIRFQDSGTETIWLQSKPSGDLVIRPQGGNETVLFGANGNVGIGKTNPGVTLDVNGYIKNKNPVFHAYRNSTWTTASYATIPFNVEVHDSTNSYNTNGTFTAPVAGYYFFSVFALTNGAVTMHLEFHKNGALTNGAEPYSANVGSYACVSGSIVIYLNVNDYVEVVLVSGGIYGGGNHHNGFCGYLIG